MFVTATSSYYKDLETRLLDNIKIQKVTFTKKFVAIKSATKNKDYNVAYSLQLYSYFQQPTLQNIYGHNTLS